MDFSTYITYPIDFLPPQGVEVHDFSALTSWFYQDVFYIHAKKGAVYGLTDAIEQKRFMAEQFGEKKVFAVIDVRNPISMTVEARRYYKSREGGQGCVACCFIINSPVSRLIANLLLTVLTTRLPVKIVASVEDALAWGTQNHYY
ncbi:MAG: hypothetical protein ACKVTZ_05030 [Bacteroidia bacterium]